jgi:hypothetical protein
VSGSLKLTQLNMISWVFFYNLIVQSFIASVLVINNIDNHYMISKIQNEDSRLYGWLAVQYTMIMLPLGMLFVVNLFGYKNNNKLFNHYVNSDIKPFISIKDSYIKFPLYLLYIVSILSVLYVMITLRTIPLTGILQGLDSVSLSVLRQEASRGFTGNTYIKNIFALGLTPILSYVAFSYYKMTNTRNDLIWFISLFIASFLILTYNIAKGPFVAYLLGYAFLTILINGSIARKTLIMFFVIILTLIIIMYFALATGGVSIGHLFNYNTGIVGRIILTQSAGTYLSFDLFPQYIDYIGFNSISSVLNSIVGAENIDRSARLLMIQIKPEAVDAGTAGVINSLFIAEAWANFGLLGALIAPFYVGIIIQTLFMFFLKLPKTPILLALFTYFSCRGSITGGFNDYMYNAGYLIIIVSFIWVYLIGFILKKGKLKKIEKNDISYTNAN